MVAEVTSQPIAEICLARGGYIFALATPTDIADELEDIDTIYEFSVSVSADLDVMLAQIKRHILATQHKWRKDKTEPEPIVTRKQNPPPRRGKGKGNDGDEGVPVDVT